MSKAFINNNFENVFYLYGYTSETSPLGYYENVSSIIGSSSLNSGYWDKYRAVRIGFSLSGASSTSFDFCFLASQYSSVAVPTEANPFVAFISEDPDKLSKKTKNTLVWGKEAINTEPNAIQIIRSLGTYLDNDNQYVLKGTIVQDLLPNTKYYLYIVPYEETYQTRICRLYNTSSKPGFLTSSEDEITYTLTLPNGQEIKKKYDEIISMPSEIPEKPSELLDEQIENFDITLYGIETIQAAKVIKRMKVYTFGGWISETTGKIYQPEDYYSDNINDTFTETWNTSIELMEPEYQNNSIEGILPSKQNSETEYKVFLVDDETIELNKNRVITYEFLGWSSSNTQNDYVYETEFFTEIVLYPIFIQNSDSGIPSFDLTGYILEKDNFEFKGWSLNSNAQNGFIGIFTPPSSQLETTLYAIWKELKEYIIRIKAHEKFGNEEILETIIGDNKTISLKDLIAPLQNRSSLEYKVYCHYYSKNNGLKDITLNFEETNNFYSISSLLDEETNTYYSADSQLLVNKNYNLIIIPSIPTPKNSIANLQGKINDSEFEIMIWSESENDNVALDPSIVLTPNGYYYEINQNIPSQEIKYSSGLVLRKIGTTDINGKTQNIYESVELLIRHNDQWV